MNKPLICVAAVVAALGYYDTTGHFGPFLRDAAVIRIREKRL